MRKFNRLSIFSMLFLAMILILVLSGCAPKISAYEEKDACTPIPGGYYFKIPDEDSCRQQCFSNCMSREMEFVKSEFTAGGNAPCNKCLCYCRQ